ncbi:hypothetical protein FSP39_005097 [Pinctada imbricata]|uniref:Uncharacterized protein n=1 Tax=Pinctada imbricata TaxID=66713 RepID=A0AA88XEP3_PINIB|nr:hypothetical protein FSP39_005097 [Pinctada imbricata]
MTNLGNDWLYVTAFNGGQAYMSPADIFASTCHPDVTKYPFDIQECDVVFLFVGDLTSDINVTAVHDHIMLDLYRRHARWNLLRTKAYVDNYKNHRFKYHILLTIQRESGFYIVGLILPISALDCLNIMVFLLPPESGERVGYSITVLLAKVVYLTIAADSLPPTSNPGVPLLCIKLFIDIMISSFIVVFVIFGLRLYHRDPKNHSIPKVIVSLSRMFRVRKYKKHTIDICKVDGERSEIGDKKSNKEDIPFQAAEEEKVTWQTLSKQLDVIFCSFSLFLLLISSGMILYLMFS